MTEVVDKPSEEIIALMNRFIARGFDVYAKWTCPKCGDRCAANEKNTFNLGGYTHEERTDGTPCGGTYTGDLYGIFAVKRFT